MLHSTYYKQILVRIFLISIIGGASRTQSFSQQMVSVKPITGLPVTGKPFNTDTGKIQFAVISDLWGGLRPGVFEDAVEKLGLLQPQFVISVGDLIDGKTYDPAEIGKQWDAFDKSISPLTMPFFYVPGNHDIGNVVMEQEWKKRLGSPYYHFIYKNALFLCVNTEDGGKGGIRDEQVAYFKKAVAENAGVRWTFLFMHRPVWQGKGDRQEGYEKIEALLQDRNYTLFSGHHHTYVRLSKNGKKHYVLGSTGGGSDLRGEKFGEFDHITLVTLNSDEPKVVNLKLDGIIKEDIVNETTYPMTQTLINETWFQPVPSVSEQQVEKKIQAEIVLHNPTSHPLKVQGNLNKYLQAYSVSPETVNITIKPGDKITQPLVITQKNGSLINLGTLPDIDVELTGSYTYGQTDYAIPAKKKLLLSWKRIPEAVKKNNMKATNLYHGRDTSGMIYLTNPEQITGPWYWTGPRDGLLRFKMLRDKDHAYIIALLSDDQWVNESAGVKDLLYLHMEDAGGAQQMISFSPWDTVCNVQGKGSIQLKDIEAQKFFNNGLCLMEFKLPLHKIVKTDGTVRMNIGFRDQDATPEKWVSTLFWKPLWNSPGNYINSGTFIIK